MTDCIFLKRLDNLINSVQADLDITGSKLAVKRQKQKELVKAEMDLDEAEKVHRVLEETCVVLGAIEEIQRKELKVKVERLVTYALTAVFRKPYVFHLVMSQRGRQTEVDFLVEVPEHPGVKFPLKDAHGGGLISVVAFILQIIVALSAKPKLRKFIVLDEPFVQVSEEFKQPLIKFVRELADKTGVQFLIISHDPELSAIGDKKYRFKLVGGFTVAEEILQ